MAKRNKAPLVRAVCRNCGTNTVGRYCHVCGQDLFAGRTHRLHELLDNSLGNIFSWDNKLFRTLWNLIAFPGRLTKEFLAGRIVRYVFPSKLFWFTTIIFFALLWSNTKIGGDAAPTTEVVQTTDTTRTQIVTSVPSAVGTAATGGSESAAEETTSPQSDDDIWSIDIEGKQIHAKELMDYFSTWSPYIVLVLVPIFALLLMLFFWRRERSYSDYIVFALHFHSLVFLLFSVGLAFSKIFPGTDIGMFLMLLQAIWFAVAVRVVYRAPIVPMIFKILLLGFVYLLLMLAALALFIIVFLVFIKNIDIFA